MDLGDKIVDEYKRNKLNARENRWNKFVNRCKELGIVNKNAKCPVDTSIPVVLYGIPCTICPSPIEKDAVWIKAKNTCETCHTKDEIARFLIDLKKE